MKIVVILIMSIVLLLGAVDINTATKKELVGLAGIGVKKADAILMYRTLKCFENIEELIEVKGIGKITMSKNRDNLTVSECK